MWLNAKNLSLPYGTIKLALRRHGPFKIKKVLSPMAYQLHLPPQWTIHPVLPPEQAAELLPWYMQWSRDLAAEMHQRRLVRNEAHRTVTLPVSYRPCDCSADWRCEPHDACFIHNSCFCPGSGSFPPVKPPRS